jgi:hypothetical protein
MNAYIWTWKSRQSQVIPESCQKSAVLLVASTLAPGTAWHKVMAQTLPEMLGLWPEPFHWNELLVDALRIYLYRCLTLKTTSLTPKKCSLQDVGRKFAICCYHSPNNSNGIAMPHGNANARRHIGPILRCGRL